MAWCTIQSLMKFSLSIHLCFLPISSAICSNWAYTAASLSLYALSIRNHAGTRRFSVIIVCPSCCLHWSNMAEIWPMVCHNMAAKPRPVCLAQVVAPLYKIYDTEKHSLHLWNYYTVAANSSSSSRTQQFTARYMQKCTVLNCLYYLPSQSWCTAELH